jgi:hypothetical protein
METTIYFCKHCGDNYARSDSCKRHPEIRPAECLRVTPQEDDVKRRAMQRVHDEFGRLEGTLTTGEDIVAAFSKTIKDDPSKERTGSME